MYDYYKLNYNPKKFIPTCSENMLKLFTVKKQLRTVVISTSGLVAFQELVSVSVSVSVYLPFLNTKYTTYNKIWKRNGEDDW